MWTRVSGMVLRYLYLYRRSLARAGEVFFWPIMDLMVWGFLTVYLQRHVVADAVLFLIGGMIFWDVLYRSQQAITLSLSEEIWIKNVINIFIAPISMFELLLSVCLMGVIKAGLATLVLGTMAALFYTFNIFTLGLALVPFLGILLLFGWAVGMITMALILRFGKAAEALVWGIPFLLQPLSAVFYPVDVLPAGFRHFAGAFPSTYVFEGMRHVLQTGNVDVSMMVKALVLNGVWLVIGSAFFGWMLGQVREKGFLSRLGME
ncbi:MAG: ABC transporter permease [Candidatus Poribacteria bacterium]|nr:ABC transporter permease [Candidatus Poribacteria bacterium]